MTTRNFVVMAIVMEMLVFTYSPTHSHARSLTFPKKHNVEIAIDRSGNLYNHFHVGAEAHLNSISICNINCSVQYSAVQFD